MKRTILPSKNTITNSLKIVIENSKKNLLVTLIGLSTIKSLFASGELTVTLTPSNVNCQGLKTGQITANVTGGQPPYQYRWSNGATTQSISNLNPGYYHCKVIDNNSNLRSEAEITLTEPEVLRILQYDAIVYPNNFNTSCYSCNDGAITVSVAGGTPPYTYLWSDGSTQQNRTNLVAKDYQLVVSDAFGCQVRELNKELSKPEREDWTANGNNNANTNSFLGTTTNFPLVFKANNNEGFRLLTDGKLGLGTSIPTEKFEVAGGNAKFGGNTEISGSLRINSLSSSTSNLPRLVVVNNAGEISSLSSMSQQNNLDNYEDNTNPDPTTSYRCGTINSINWVHPELYNYPNGSTITTLTNEIVTCNNVKVGIGVLHPLARLHVGGNIIVTGGKFHVSENGNVGIGTGIPSKKLHVVGDSYFNGNVGIGTDNPGYRLDVIGDINIANGHFFRINGNPMEFSQWTTTSSNYAGKNITFKTSNDNANTVSIGYACNQNLRWSNAYFGFNAKRDANNINFVSKGNSSSNNGGSLIYSNSTGAIYFSVIPPNGAGNDQTYNDNFVTQHEVLELNQYGVHINKPLTVEGTTILNGETHTRRVKVCAGNGWCDYVFDKDYKLTSLLDVEKYIKANNHLPDVPSAKEVTNSEIDLFEMQKIQMKKIEELMLYVIELKKENQNMVKEIAQLKK